MICEFTAGTEHWYVDTDKTYVKIFDNIDQRVIKENHNLGLLAQLEGNRIAAYEGTYAMIGVSPTITTTHFFLEGGKEANRIIWRPGMTEELEEQVEADSAYL